MKADRTARKWQTLLALAQLSVVAYSVWRDWRAEWRRLAAPSPSPPPAPVQAPAPVPQYPRTAAPTPGPAAAMAPPQRGRLKAIGAVAVGAGRQWLAHRAASKGAALALYTLFSLAPMLVLVVTLAGLIFGEDAVRQALLEQMRGLMGAQGAEAIRIVLQGSQRKTESLTAGLVSAAIVLVSATTAFAELKDSLDELWEVPKGAQSGLWGVVRERFLSFGLILVLVLMLLASLAVSAALAALSRLWSGGAVETLFEFVLRGSSSVVSFVIVAVLFAVIFKYLPATRISWRDVAIGALITALLFTAGKALITLYVARSDISSSYGAAGSVVVLMTWIYYSAQIFFYGALFTHEYATKLGSRARTRPDQRGAAPATSSNPLPT